MPPRWCGSGLWSVHFILQAPNMLFKKHCWAVAVLRLVCSGQFVPASLSYVLAACFIATVVCVGVPGTSGMGTAQAIITPIWRWKGLAVKVLPGQ